ncbi:MAG: MerR family transcriptional regulator [Frankia sp.]
MTTVDAAARRPVGDPDAAAVAVPGRAITIGEVLDRLRSDFPDVTLSKIRYLEAEGLVEPARTSSNYRKYSAADVERLRYVLGAQRDRYLPLRVIKEELAALDHGRDPTAPGPRPVGGGRTARDGARDLLGDPEGVRLSRRELLTSSGLDEDGLAELERHGLLGPRPGGTYYDGDALLVAATAARMARYGVGARHLRTFRAAADREAGLVEQVAAPLRGRRDAGAGQNAAEVADELAGLCLRLHAALLRTRLRSAQPG